MKTCWLIPLVLLALALPVRASDNLAAFPAAEAGMVRHVLVLPEQEDETGFKVELIVGRTVEVDAVNRHFFTGAIVAETIEGWGFTRYVVPELGPMAGTLMAVEPDAPKEARFVALAGEPYLIRYNSRLPVVVYVPEGVEVRYRIWSAEAETRPVPEG
ncbi:MAG TPA: ecotin family protein [Kiritimatiellia bacterium]|nr:ecotin family protein [Kiritimatiellia bacterium]HMP35133.1 ecotin family protein [Kiritimatiellia bacterium]